MTIATIIALHSIRKTCPCIVYPLDHHFYIVKKGYAGVYLFFLFLHQFIDCGYSLEPPRRGGSNGVPTTYVLSKNKKNIENYLLKIFNFYNLKNNLYLHGHVFIMKELYLFFNRCIVQGITCSIYEPRREKTGLRGFRPGPTQTDLYQLRKELEA